MLGQHKDRESEKSSVLYLQHPNDLAIGDGFMVDHISNQLTHTICTTDFP